MDYFSLLPNEIISDHIFIYLKAIPFTERPSYFQSDLKNLTLVCKRFNEIIGTSKELISNFELIISTKTLENGLFNAYFVRKYQKIIVIDSDINQQKELLQVFERYGRNLEILTIVGNLLLIYGRTLFLNTPKLHTVIASCFKTIKYNNLTQKCQITDLPNLKNLIFTGNNSSYPVLNVFSNCNLENLYIGYAQNLAYPKITNWKLKKFSVLSMSNNTFRFLDEQKQYLEDLEVYVDNAEFLQFIMNNLKVKKLKLQFTKNVNVPKDIQELNSNLKHLVIEHVNNRKTTKQMILQLLRYYPCLETIKYDATYTGVFDEEKIHMLDLHTLDVFLPDSIIILSCYMPKLQKLTIKSCRKYNELYHSQIFDSVEDLTFICGPYVKNVILRFPNVKSLTLNHVLLKKNEFIDLVSSLSELKMIKLFKPIWDKRGDLNAILNVLNKNIQVIYI